VINDGSIDQTACVAHSFGERIRYFEQSNQGPAAARNVGMAVATGKYVAFLDADDYWLPGFLKATVEFLDGNPSAVAVSIGWQYHSVREGIKVFPTGRDGNDIPLQPSMLKNFFDFWGRYDHLHTGTVLMNRSKLGDNGIQRPDLRIFEDLEFWAYLGTLGPWGFIPQIYWFGDSARFAAKDGWLKRYRLRRRLCPNVEAWQARILPRLKDADWPGFKQIRGKVAAACAQNLILAGQISEAHETIINFEGEMPKTRVAQLLRLGKRWGALSWLTACWLIHLREYQKAFFLYVASRIRRTLFRE